MNFRDFCEGFDLRITNMSTNIMEFDVVGLPSAFVNALRRLLISEVPTMAIENVFIINNSSFIHDEILSYRLGLVPILANATLFNFQNDKPLNEKNTIVFRLAVNSTFSIFNGKSDKVWSSAMEWLQNGSEMPEETHCQFGNEQANTKPSIQPVYKNILLAILAFGNEILLEAICIKGTGKQHAKWSPVATVWYRLLPEAGLLKDLHHDLAKELDDNIPDLVNLVKIRENYQVVLNDVAKNELWLDKFRRCCTETKWSSYIELRKVKDHFLFTIETSGVIHVTEVVLVAIKLLINKIQRVSTII